MNFHGPFLSLDTRYKLEGHTVLYIPAEAMNMEPEAVVKDKELVQRLESEWLALPVCCGAKGTAEGQPRGRGRSWVGRAAQAQAAAGRTHGGAV